MRNKRNRKEKKIERWSLLEVKQGQKAGEGADYWNMYEGLLLLSAWAVNLFALCGEPFIPWLPLGISLPALLFMLKGWKRPKLQSGLLLAAALAVLTASLLARRALVSGLVAYVNGLIKLVSIDLGIPGQLLDNEAAGAWSMTWFLAAVCMVLAVCLALCVRFAYYWALYLPALGFLALQAALDLDMGAAAPSSLFAAVLLTGACRLQRKGNGEKKTLTLCISFSIIVFAVLGGFAIGVGQMDIQPAWMEHTAAAAAKKAEKLRFDKDEYDGLLQGSLQDSGGLKRSKETMLEVKMSKPASLYLKGMVGSYYTGKEWQLSPGQEVWDNRQLFYWLNQDGFSALSQLSQLSRAIGFQKPEENTIEIRNLAANSQYLYLPYEMNSLQADGSMKTGNDACVVSRQMKGLRNYRCQADNGLLQDFSKLAAKAYKARKNGQKKETRDFFQSESHYNEFVYRTYLQLPKETKTFLAGCMKPPKGTVAYDQAYDMIHAVLDQQVTYQEKTKKPAEDQDFLQYFLETEQAGYAVHYATAAVLMYRYLGIPARYVEGYLITPEETEGLTEDDTISVTGESAHAWAEIYVDQVGWMPVEFTPKYEKVMDVDARGITGKSAAKQQEGTYTAKAKPQIMMEEKKIPENYEEPKKKNTFPWHWAALGVMIALLAAFLLYRMLKRRHMLQIRAASFTAANKNAALCSMFRYSEELLRCCGIPKGSGGNEGSIRETQDLLRETFSEGYADAWKQAFHAAQYAFFSQHDVQAEQLAQVRSFMEETKKQVLRKVSWRRKMKMKFWDNLI